MINTSWHLFVAFLFISSLVCRVSAGNTTSEVYHIPLTGDGHSKLFWTLDRPRRTIHFEVHIILPEDDWLAVGFSDYGEVDNADFGFMWSDWKRKRHLEDVWTDNEGVVWSDKKQDYTDFMYHQEDQLLKFTFKRREETSDIRDYHIDTGTTHVVWATGRGPLYRLDGLNIHTASAHGFQRTQILKCPVRPPPLEAEAWELRVRGETVQVPGDDTTYWCQVVKLSKKLKKKHHVVQYEAAITDGNEHVVHHMELFHCVAPVTEHMPPYSGLCEAPERPPSTLVCKKVLAAWAIGAPAIVYPAEAGLAIGGSDFNLYAVLEVHYNNPDLISGLSDRSGVRFTLTPTLRQYDSGVIELGLEYTDKMAIPPLQPRFSLSGYCVTECTALALPPDGITVFASQLHTHLTGVKTFTRHFRNGREINNLNRDNHYSPHFQEIRLLQKPVKVLPGDVLIHTCLYNTESRPNVTLGGFATTDEMCVNYLHYYPRIELEVCKSSIAYDDLHQYFDYLREWENQETSSLLPISVNYGAIDWTPLRVQVLDDLYHHSDLSMQCNKSSGERFPGDWEGIELPKKERRG